MSSGPSNSAVATPSMSVRAMPWVFVLIWSTGFIVARFGMPYVPPLHFLSIRYALTLLCFGLWVALAKVAWPSSRVQWGHLAVTGFLMQAGYLGGVWSAVRAGMGAALVALLVGLQPVLTALWLAYRGGAPSRRQWLGLLLGFAGLVLVVWRKLENSGEVNPTTMALAGLALLSITIGTLYQKRFVAPCDVRSANLVQQLAALAMTLPLALVEAGPTIWNVHSIGAMAWSVLALSVGGSSLLYMLIQRGSATTVSSLLYLVPPCTAVMAWLLFNEPITALTLAGIVLTAAGVSLVVRRT
ncbi:MAG: DMT family transporter [Burkholderiaceae bacterium]